MVTDDSHTVAKLVQERLRRNVPFGSRLRVVAEDVLRQVSDGVWWYVPVSIHRDPENMSVIYELLSTVEERLQEEDGVSVLLVPRIIPFQRWEDIA